MKNKETLFLALIVVLVLLAGIQAYQLNAVTQLINSPQFAASVNTAVGAAAQSGLPAQVGGCG